MTTSTEPVETVTPLLPNYVYALIDPENHTVFYIGKGQGRRVSHHWAQAQRDAETDTAKLARLRALQNRDTAPIELIIGRYESEAEAFAVEATLISWVYGFDNLTNAVRGHGHDSIRSLGDWGPAARIDIERRARVHDLQFTNGKIAGLMNAGAYDYLSDLAAELAGAGLDVRDFSNADDRAYHPGESNGWLGLLVRIHDIDFIIYFSKSMQPKIEIATTLASRAARPKLVERGWTLAEPRNIKAGPTSAKEGRYQAILPRPGEGPDSAPQTQWSFDTRAIEPVVRTLTAISRTM